jgi:uncharacterized peroxidase-related enzyme
MAFITVVDEADAAGPLRQTYESVAAARGRVANILKVHSLAPQTLTAHLELYKRLMFGPSDLSREEREMIAVAVSSANRCHY